MRNNEPSPDVISPNTGIALEKEIFVPALDTDSITIPLTASLHSGCLTDINHLVDYEFPSVFPSERYWENSSVICKSGDHIHINLSIVHFPSPLTLPYILEKIGIRCQRRVNDLVSLPF